MDRAIWASWYDVDDQHRATFLAWMHEQYLPALALNKRFAWVCHYAKQSQDILVGRGQAGAHTYVKDEVSPGTEYVLLVAAAAPRAFLAPYFLEAMDAGVANASEMLGCRRGIRHSLFLEEDRINGPAFSERDRGDAPAPIIQFGAFIAKSAEADFDMPRYYAQTRLPFMQEQPGCVRTRKLAGLAGWAKHGILYEFTSKDLLAKVWDSVRASAGSPNHGIGAKTIHAPGSPMVASRIWPAP